MIAELFDVFYTTHVKFRGLPWRLNQHVFACDINSLWEVLVLKRWVPVLRRISSKVCGGGFCVTTHSESVWLLSELWEKCHRLFLLGQHVLLSKAQKKYLSTSRGFYICLLHKLCLYLSTSHNSSTERYSLPFNAFDTEQDTVLTTKKILIFIKLLINSN